MKNLIILFALNFLFFIAHSQNNDSLVKSKVDTTQSGYIIELDTARAIIKVTDVSSGIETLITKEDKIKVYVNGGNIFTGRWEIIDESNIKVKQVIVPISVIENIKRDHRNAGKITLCIGAGLMITGIIVALTTMTTMDYTGAALFLVGGVVTIVSIPIMISNSNKKKANAFVGFENLGLIGNPYSNTTFIAVGLSIDL